MKEYGDRGYPMGGIAALDQRGQTPPTPERLRSLSTRFKLIHKHFYQPVRGLYYSVEGSNTPQKVFDINAHRDSRLRRMGIRMGWNEFEARNTLFPLARRNLLKTDFTSFNVYGGYADWMQYNEPKEWSTFQKAVIDSGNLPAGDQYTHPIMVKLSYQTKRMQQRIGNLVYKDHWNINPDSSWIPEMAVNLDVLDAMYDENIRVVALRNYQVDAAAPVVKIKLSGKNRYMYAVVSDGEIGAMPSFGINDPYGTHRRPNADEFVAKIVEVANRSGFTPNVAYDGETEGDHWPERPLPGFEHEKWGTGVLEFIEYRDKFLAEAVRNGTLKYDRALDFINAPETKLKYKVSSWTCAHGISRWQGRCNCGIGSGDHRKINTIKADLDGKLGAALSRIENYLDRKYPPKPGSNDLSQWRIDYINWFMTQRKNIALGKPIDTSRLNNPDYKKYFLPELILLQGGMQSCGFYFEGDNPGSERDIPRGALQAVAYLTGWEDISPAA